ncbi:hypothetical protein HKX48_006946 [Thoreauomyces humboldtii]|nr:hypothetical protein HKX48_006946 [Thoreauomyces humboldtii]
MQALACSFVKRGKAGSALEVYLVLQEQRPTLALSLEISRLLLQLAKGDAHSDRGRQRVELAIHTLQRCQTPTHQIEPHALSSLDEVYKFIAQHCPDLATPACLLPDLVATAGLPETRNRQSVHVWLLRAILDSGCPESAWDYVLVQRHELATSLGWLELAIHAFEDVSTGFCGPERDLEASELRLWLHATRLRLILEKGMELAENRLQYIEDFEQMVHDTDALLSTIGFQSRGEWVYMRSEYMAIARMLRGLNHFQALCDALDFMTDVKHCQPTLQTAMGEWRLSISYRLPHSDPKLQQEALRRLSTSAHSILALLFSLDHYWLLSSHDARAPHLTYIRKHPDASAAELRALPKLRLAALAEDGLPSDIRAMLSWVRNDRLFFIDQAFFTMDPWDLARFVGVAAWYYSSDRLRRILREMFAQMPESPTTSVALRGANHQARPILSIRDMEAFILTLLVERQAWCFATKNATPAEAIFVSAIGGWKPTPEQLQFWKSAVVSYGRDKFHCSLEERLDEEQFAVAIELARGRLGDQDMALEELMERRALYGSLALVYADLALGLPDRSDEAHYYAELCERLDGKIETAETGNTAGFAERTAQGPTSAEIMTKVKSAAKSIVEPESSPSKLYSPSHILRASRGSDAAPNPVEEGDRASSADSTARTSVTGSPDRATSAKADLDRIIEEESVDTKAVKNSDADTETNAVPTTNKPFADRLKIAMKEYAESEASTPSKSPRRSASPSATQTEDTPRKAFSSARAQRLLREFQALSVKRTVKPERSLDGQDGPNDTEESRDQDLPITPAPKSRIPSALATSFILNTPTPSPSSPATPSASHGIHKARSLPQLGPSTPGVIVAPPASPLGKLPRPSPSPKRVPRSASPDRPAIAVRRTPQQLPRPDFMKRLAPALLPDDAKNSFTPKRDPMELRGGRGDLSELRRRGFVTKSTVFADDGNVSPSKIGIKVQRQRAKLEELTALRMAE